MSSTKARIQVTVDPELAAALAEFAGPAPRSRAVRDLALRGAGAMRAQALAEQDAIEHLLRVAAGEDDRYDFAAAAAVHASR